MATHYQNKRLFKKADVEIFRTEGDKEFRKTCKEFDLCLKKIDPSGGLELFREDETTSVESVCSGITQLDDIDGTKIVNALILAKFDSNGRCDVKEIDETDVIDSTDR
jgi:hypothetical protein